MSRAKYTEPSNKDLLLRPFFVEHEFIESRNLKDFALKNGVAPFRARFLLSCSHKHFTEKWCVRLGWGKYRSLLYEAKK